MKKIMSLLLIAVLLIMLVPNVFATEIIASGNFINEAAFYSLDSDGVLRVYGTGPAYGVGFINQDIKKVIVEDGITNLNFKDLVQNSTALESVEVAGTVEKIGKESFVENPTLNTVILHEGIKKIEYKAFAQCEIETVTLPDSIETIGAYAFEGCKSLKELHLGSGLKTVAEYAFSGCDALTSVYMKDNSGEISGSAFFDDKNIEKVYAESLEGWCSIKFDGPTLLQYGAKLIAGDKEIIDLVIPEGVTRLAGWNFAGYQFLNTVKLPDSLTTIGDGAFFHSNVTLVSFGNNLQEIGNRAFMECDKLTEISMPDTVNKLGTYVFCTCRGLKSVKLSKSLTIIPESTFSGCEKLTDITIPDSVETVDDHAFVQCLSLGRVVFGKKVKELCAGAFFHCRNLRVAAFRGNVPALKASIYSIFGCSDGPDKLPYMTVYYLAGSNFPTPLWESYPTAVYKENELPDPGDYCMFDDVRPDAWYYKAVMFAEENELMNGTGSGFFEPESPMTRAMLVTVLWRYDGSKNQLDMSPFTDVTYNNWFMQAVIWAAKNGVVNGTSKTTFSPDDNITREQMATILYRFAQKNGIDVSKKTELSKFPDAAKVSDYAKDAISWCVAEGIIGGSDGYLLPQGNATRAQVATILMRFLENVASKGKAVEGFFANCRG